MTLSVPNVTVIQYIYTELIPSFICSCNELLLHWNRKNSSLHGQIISLIPVDHFQESVAWRFLVQHRETLPVEVQN